MPGRIAPKSAEMIVESGSSDEEEGSGQSSPSPQQANTSSLKRKSPATTKSSTKRVRISSEEPAARQPPSSKSSKKTAAPAASESSSEVSSSSDEGEHGSSPQARTTNGTIATQTSPSRNITSHPTAPYEPPAGFEPLASSSSSSQRPSSEVSKLLDPTTLSAKQVWHITAPASLPISALTSLDLEHLTGHDTAITHNNTSYALTEGAVGSTALLLPKGNGYTPLKGGFAKVLHVKQMPGVKPEKAKDAQGKSLATVPQAKEVRQHPDGLRTRYWPPGFEPEGAHGNVQLGKSSAVQEVVDSSSDESEL